MECKFYVGQTVAREWPVDTFDYDLAAAGVLTPPLNEPVTISRIFQIVTQKLGIGEQMVKVLSKTPIT
ncbi:MAG: hypothetical protein AAF737_04180, partial [Pseudomonadota bacterium]